MADETETPETKGKIVVSEQDAEDAYALALELLELDRELKSHNASVVDVLRKVAHTAFGIRI